MYRKELKYIVGDATLLDVRNRIAGIMRKDPHQSGDFYRIRSVYFDSPTYTCYRENQAGVSTREKYRIRIYDCKSDVISAEIKIRHRDTISKMSSRIDNGMFDALISGNWQQASGVLSEALAERDDRVLEKYLAKFATENYSPACIVDYERSAYVYDTGNVRITIDRNVFGSSEISRMFDDKLTGRAMLDKGLHVLEIKYDEFLPDEILQVIVGLSLSRSSCSKYALCMSRFLV